MAKCAICEKGAHFGNNVSHSHRRSPKMWKSNVKSVRVKTEGGSQKMYAWLNDTHYWLFKIGEATIVFLLFFNLVFKRLFYKHSERISRKNGKHCPFSFFDVKGWIIMIFMIAFGITIRALHLLPNSFISVFYTGLSTALIITGFLFLRQGKTVGN